MRFPDIILVDPDFSQFNKINRSIDTTPSSSACARNLCSILNKHPNFNQILNSSTCSDCVARKNHQCPQIHDISLLYHQHLCTNLESLPRMYRAGTLPSVLISSRNADDIFLRRPSQTYPAMPHVASRHVRLCLAQAVPL